ncbi:Netrin-4, partial [Varanus komodoensis]
HRRLSSGRGGGSGPARPFLPPPPPPLLSRRCACCSTTRRRRRRRHSPLWAVIRHKRQAGSGGRESSSAPLLNAPGRGSRASTKRRAVKAVQRPGRGVGGSGGDARNPTGGSPGLERSSDWSTAGACGDGVSPLPLAASRRKIQRAAVDRGLHALCPGAAPWGVPSGTLSCWAALPWLQAHPPSAMVDSSFKLPHTWWQSAQGVHREKIQLNLETEFYFTHLIMVFKSPRPAAMVLERSQDFGKTWKPYKYFSTNCSATFGLDDDISKKGAICTSRYSGHFPCSGGEVIYRALSPLNPTDDPYSPEAQAQLKITNLRVRLLKRQSCPCYSNDLNTKPPQLAYYAVYDFIVKGSCFCNGHADHCGPIKGFRPVKAAGVFHVELIVNIVLPSTMTSPGNLQMAKPEPQMNADPVSAMGILILVTLTWKHGWHQGTEVVASAIIVNIILKDDTASGANQATTETSGSPFLPQMPVNVSQYQFVKLNT